GLGMTETRNIVRRGWVRIRSPIEAAARASRSERLVGLDVAAVVPAAVAGSTTIASPEVVSVGSSGGGPLVPISTSATAVSIGAIGSGRWPFSGPTLSRSTTYLEPERTTRK